MSNSLKRIKTNENIQVYVRVRPTNERERLLRSMEVVEATTNRDIVVKQTIDTKMTKKYSFDRTFGQESKQCDVYSTVVAPLIEEVLAGYNCTVFAYGQTGTGKTHTMVGDETPTLSSSWEDATDVGMIPRALSHLFDELRLMEVEFSMRISYLELYNEELSDLLSTSDNSQIRIFDDANKKGSIIVQGLEEIPVHNTSDVFKLLAKGQEKRKTASTLMNAQSSRSHTIFSMLVHIKENGIEGEELLKIGKLNLVDLAGSENITKSGNEKGVRTRETVNINQSLLTLGRVITALVERAPHIPYRESKLTRLLQESLGGRTKTSIIATISPGHKDLEETLSTLEYAHRAKNIQNKPEVNQKLTKKTVLKEYTEEIDRLKRDLMAARDKNGIYLAEETYNDMQYKLDIQNRELNEKMLHIKAIKDELASKQRLFHEVSLNLVEKTEELKLKDEKLNQTEKVLGRTKKDLLSTKKRYQEKKHLLENHVRTETVLSNQAYQLKDVAQKASNDTYELHNTIERRQKVDKDTKHACENFQDEIKLFLNNITIKLETLFNEFNFRSQTINSDIGKNIIEHNNVSSATIEKIGMLMNLNKNSTEKSNVYLTKYENILTELSDTQQLAIREMINDIIEKENLHRNQSEQQITALIETLNCQKNTFNDKCSELLSHIQNNSTIINNFCKTCSIELETFSQKLLNDIKENHTIVNQTIAQNNLSENNLLNIAEQLQKEIENIQQNNNKLKTTIPKFECTEEQIEKYNLNELENLENHRKLCNNNEMQLNEFVNSLGANLSENCCINENTIKMMSQNNNVQSNLVIEKMNEIEIENTKQNAKILETMQSHSSNLKAQQTSDQIEMVNNCQQLSESITNAFTNFKDYQLQYISLNDLLCKSITDYGVDNKQDVLKCMQNVENFYKNGIKLYSSTGSTPIRTQYQYPQNLASTSPHERLIQRFWISNNAASKLDCSTVTFNEDIENEFFDGIQNDCTSTFRATDNNDSKDDDKTLKEYTNSNQNNVTNVLKPIQKIMSVSANNIKNEYIETNKENLSD